MLDERLGKLHFWLTFIGFHTTFLIQHWLGTRGMARRYADYLPEDGFTTWNAISTVGSFILGASTLVFLWNVYISYKAGPVVAVDDPWGYGNSLEWATSCPPPLRNFDRMPRIRSERPAFDLKYPELAAAGQSRLGPPEGGAKPLSSGNDGGARYREDTSGNRR
jgi:cytochrome c oxidase subunit 1